MNINFLSPSLSLSLSLSLSQASYNYNYLNYVMIMILWCIWWWNLYDVDIDEYEYDHHGEYFFLICSGPCLSPNNGCSENCVDPFMIGWWWIKRKIGNFCSFYLFLSYDKFNLFASLHYLEKRVYSLICVQSEFESIS